MKWKTWKSVREENARFTLEQIQWLQLEMWMRTTAGNRADTPLLSMGFPPSAIIYSEAIFQEKSQPACKRVVKKIILKGCWDNRISRPQIPVFSCRSHYLPVYNNFKLAVVCLKIIYLQYFYFVWPNNISTLFVHLFAPVQHGKKQAFSSHH